MIALVSLRRFARFEKCVHAFAIIAIGLIVFFPIHSVAETFNVRTLNSVFVQAGNTAPQTSSVQDGVASAQASGGEKSQCTSYGRSSYAHAEANVSPSQSGAGVSLTFVSTSITNGGHFRTCLAGCVANACVGIHGNDTDAAASSQATADLDIEVKDSRKVFAYEAIVSSTLPDIRISLTYADGTPVVGKAEGRYALNERQHIIKAHISLSTAASDRGGCCSQNSTKSGVVSVRLEQAPLISSAYAFSPFIKGGRPTAGYPSVVSIGLNGRLHCTGTYIGARSILTAAHCIYGYDIAAKKMEVRFGNDFYQPTEKFDVVAGTYPNDQSEKFNPQTFEDDIAILTIGGTPSAKPATLISSPADWRGIIEKHYPISIVGFGFNVIEGGAVNPGIKREARITILKNDVRNRSVSFANLEANTCNGDSGGPTFIEVDGKELLLAAVTSGGDDACSRGVNIRVDAFARWISANKS